MIELHIKGSGYSRVGCQSQLGRKVFRSGLHTSRRLGPHGNSEKRVRHRLLDVLKEPAFGVIRTAKLQNPRISVQQCLQSLRDVFRWSTSYWGTYYKLIGTFQQKGEAASLYLLHLEWVVQQAVEQGARNPAKADHAGSDRSRSWLIIVWPW